VDFAEDPEETDAKRGKTEPGEISSQRIAMHANHVIPRAIKNIP
jgi:hypothetical protein